MAHASGGAQRQTQNSQTSVDANTAGQMGSIWNAGVASGNAGPSGLLTDAAGYNSGLMSQGATGAAALGGDAAATQKLMDPYQQQVMDANDKAYQKTQAQSVNQTNDLATKAGAFGGSRHGVAEGVALGNNAAAHDAQNAGLLYGGYNDAMGRASTLAQMGGAAGAMNSQLGMQGVGSPEQWRLQQMKAGFMGPTGQTSSGAQAGVQGSAGFSLFGG